jgi:hypothetical protein
MKSFEPIQGMPKLVGLEREPIPYRPIVYDVAYSGIDFPVKNLERVANGQERLEPGQEGEQKSFLKGVFGLWK